MQGGALRSEAHVAARVVEDDEREREGLQRREGVLEVDVELVVVDLAHQEADVVVGAVLG